MARATKDQPVSQVVWITRDMLRANDYNPNHVAPAELRLLKKSILSSGWTQPIVCRRDGEIVDGYHRYTVAADPDVAALTAGLVPVVYLSPTTPVAEQMEATVRHNRARGQHTVLAMATLLRRLVEDEGVDPDTLIADLGMEDEEIERLMDRAGMPVRVGQEGLGEGWIPG